MDTKEVVAFGHNTLLLLSLVQFVETGDLLFRLYYCANSRRLINIGSTPNKSPKIVLFRA